ncbi:hypothetical protein M407DRAFT_215523, partial [Tulasnella calospora MUT 4182]
ACLLAVTNYSHEALVNQVPTTKRDIYYKDPGLFEKQSVVDKIVDDLAATFDLDRSDLGVRASSKGLFAGSGLSIHLRHGGTAMGNDYDSTLIPCDAEISTLEISQDIAFVLIVEKEAVFQTLCRLGFPCHPLLKGPGILITGKGYPDVATRELVNTFSKELPRDVPILAVVDADPHGIEILSVFKFGSAAMDHQRDRLAAPRIQWIGVFSSELQSLGIPPSETIPLTKIDHKKAMSMLRRAADSMPRSWKRELSHLLHSRRKAEIEIICNATVPAAQVFREGLLRYASDSHEDISIPPTDITGSTLLVVYLASKINAAIEEAKRAPSIDRDVYSQSRIDLVKKEPFS